MKYTLKYYNLIEIKLFLKHHLHRPQIDFLKSLFYDNNGSF